jgi:hypothetical protein
MPRSRKRGNGAVTPSTPSPTRDRHGDSFHPRRESSVHSSPDRPTGPLSITIAPEDREVVKVNNANLTELKNACDDAVKRVRALPLEIDVWQSLIKAFFWLLVCSSYRSRICSSRYTCIQMSDWD